MNEWSIAALICVGLLIIWDIFKPSRHKTVKLESQVKELSEIFRFIVGCPDCEGDLDVILEGPIPEFRCHACKATWFSLHFKPDPNNRQRSVADG